MKKGTLFLFLFTFSISLVYASPILNIQSTQIQPGETFLAKISSSQEFASNINSDDIKFLEGRREIFFESDIVFYEGNFYLYAYTTREGNFTIKIENILYKEDSNLKSTTLESLFNVKTNILVDEETNETSTKILSIKPGFIRATEEPVIELSNKGNSSISIGENQSIEPGQKIQIEISQENLFSNYLISTYKDFSIPIIRPSPEDKIIPEVEHKLKHNPDLLLLNLFTNNESTSQIELFNLGNTNITEMKFSSDIAFMKIEEIDEMPARTTHNLSLEFNAKEQGHYQGNVSITYVQEGKTKNLSIPLSIFVLPSGSSQDSFEISNDTCEAKGGQVCSSTQKCNGSITFTKGQVTCCLDSCIQKETKNEGSGMKWVVGLIILLVLAGVGFYFYKRQKNIKPKKPEDQLAETSKKYSQRFQEQKPQRIKGGLQNN